MSYKLVLDPSDGAMPLRNLLGSPSVTESKKGKIILRGENHTQSEADTILSDYLANRATEDLNYETDMKLRSVMRGAQGFGRELMEMYGARNLAAGKTDAQIDTIDTDLANITRALISGSLKLAKSRAEAFTPTAEVTQADIDWFVAQINTYLNN